MSTVFKSLQPKDVKTTPFQAFKQFKANISVGANDIFTTNLDGCTVYKTEYELISSYDYQYPGHTNLDQGNPQEEARFKTTTNGYFQTVMHQQLDALFYRHYLSHNHTVPGNTNINHQYRSIGWESIVISCGNKIIGEGILPTSVYIESAKTPFVDDGFGNIVLSGSNPVGYDDVAHSTTFNKYFKYIDEPPGDFVEPLSYGGCRLQADMTNVTFMKDFSYAAAKLDDSRIVLRALENGIVREKLNFTNKDYAIAFRVKAQGSGVIATKKTPTDDWASIPGGGTTTNTTLPPGCPYRILSVGGILRFEKTDGTTTISMQGGSIGAGFQNCVIQRTGNLLEMYVGNTLVDSTTDTFIGADNCSSSDLSCANNSDIVIGSDYDGSNALTGNNNGITSFHLFNRSLTTTEILNINSTDSINSHCGNVFYENGLIVLTNAALTKKAPDLIRYNSTVTLLETQIFCTVGPGDYNKTLNPTTFTWNPITNQLETACKYNVDEFRPYVTAIGLYDDFNNLVALGKLSTPVQTSRTTDTTFVVKFDR